MRLPTGAHTGQTIRYALACLTLCCCALVWSDSNADSASTSLTSTGQPVRPTLSSAELIEAFSDVTDRGVVSNSVGVVAETRWQADGRFETHWWHEDVMPEARNIHVVRGRWKVQHDTRCVRFDHSTDLDWQCAGVIKNADGSYGSLNPDGSLHGVHELTPLDVNAPWAH